MTLLIVQRDGNTIWLRTGSGTSICLDATDCIDDAAWKKTVMEEISALIGELEIEE